MILREQRKKLYEALLSALPDFFSVKQMLLFELDKNLDAIAAGSNLQETIFNLIIKAEAEGWVEDLVFAAHEFNPGNPLLRNFFKNSCLKSERDVDYTQLRDLLAAEKWQEADKETLRIMLVVAGRKEEGWFFPKDIYGFPCKDLYTIDWLWGKYSNGRFGFSAQKLIYKRLYGITDRDIKLMVEHRDRWIFAFYDAVGWTGKSYNELTFNLQAPVGHLPRLEGGSTWDLTDEDFFEEYGIPIPCVGGLGEALFFRITTCNFSRMYF